MNDALESPSAADALAIDRCSNPIDPVALPDAAEAKTPRPPKAPKAPKPEPLSTDELTAALSLTSGELVEELHALSLRTLLAEDQRENRADAKAQGLLVTAGLSLTAASTFGGMLLNNPLSIEKSVGANMARIAVAIYAVGLLAGLLASLFALKSLRLRKTYRTIDERAAFDSTALATADNEGGATARTAYRRYMTVHQWRIWQQNFAVNDAKADAAKIGQLCFAIFLGTLIFIGMIAAYAAFQGFSTH